MNKRVNEQSKMKYLTKSILRMGKRKRTAHKGDFGRVLVVAGSEDYPGAAVLASGAAKAVLRSGADYIVVAAPKKVAWVINTYFPDVITKKIDCRYFQKKHANQIIKLSSDFDVVLIGPGIGKRSGSFLKKIITGINKQKVIDADGIRAVKLQDTDNAILTPHKGEFRILLRNSRLNEDNYRKKIGSNALLIKGAVDKIVSKTKTAYNKTGNAVMTKAGTGDVLAGLCAGFAAQLKAEETKDLFRAACMGAYLNGKVGDYLLKKKGRTFIASDLIENIHKVFK